ncbi:Hypothetical protein SFBmNL_00437 [Candidatus Arthromitus sp. SFB-mouse-NL]|uniref:hypothetical protein n=1 Tax=Candidatus Arthromitus sp. SFB-mouse-NL TaxID=1508644 RepID=UPI00049B016C|nr:hypothetical protein [Candidatus Arthromitus sp. SFB-mouse-NL]AID44346.1 Hypothetical protein SFBmNL_00437 [Candidatus Arthromitus sp. SFB-mouse-NL]
MIKSNFIKKSASFVAVIMLFLFTLISCGSNHQKNVVDDFLNHLKDGKFEESLVYLSDNESKEMYVKYIESLTSMDDLDDDTKKIYDVVKSKVMDFTYSIGESQDITDDRIKIKVTINNFNLYDAYKKTLQHILSEVLVDQDASNVSNTENISNLFISYVEDLKRESNNGEFTLIKQGDNWVIELDDEALSILFSSYLDMINYLN